MCCKVKVRGHKPDLSFSSFQTDKFKMHYTAGKKLRMLLVNSHWRNAAYLIFFRLLLRNPSVDSNHNLHFEVISVATRHVQREGGKGGFRACHFYP